MILFSKSVVGNENLYYYKNDCYDPIDENYLESAEYFATLLNQYPEPPALPQTSAPVSTTFSRKLPNLDVPTFSGQFLDWLSFKDFFQASVIKVDDQVMVKNCNF